MRRAILQELCEPLDPAEPPPAYKLQAGCAAVEGPPTPSASAGYDVR